MYLCAGQTAARKQFNATYDYGMMVSVSKSFYSFVFFKKQNVSINVRKKGKINLIENWNNFCSQVLYEQQERKYAVEV